MATGKTAKLFNMLTVLGFLKVDIIIPINIKTMEPITLIMIVDNSLMKESST
jgi:hypothetical protein